MHERSDPEQIRTLISAESILSSFLLLYLSGHIQAWSQNIEKYQFYSVTIFLSIILHVGCVFTLFRSIILAFQSLHSENRDKRADLYYIAYDLFFDGSDAGQYRSICWFYFRCPSSHFFNSSNAS